MGYRICENKYGYYKIQRQQKKIKLFGITFRKEWVDFCFYPLNTEVLVIFNTVEEAQEQVDRLMENNEHQQDKIWVCV
jgi:hypothetical protein